MVSIPAVSCGVLVVSGVIFVILIPSCCSTSLSRTYPFKQLLLNKRQPVGYKFHFAQQRSCTQSTNGLPMYRCPTLDSSGGVRCINDNSLCNHVPDCPEGEDEQPSLCLFYKVIDRDLRALFDFIVNRFEAHLTERH